MDLINDDEKIERMSSERSRTLVTSHDKPNIT